MGKTGSGKSSVLNSLTNTAHFKVGNTFMSETQSVQSFTGKFRGQINSPDIVFIDTPGFFDSRSNDNKIIASIALSLHEIKDGLNLILFCFPAYEIRLDSSMQASWRFLKLIMGRAVYEHVIIVLTHGNRLSAQELEKSVVRMTTEFIPYLRDKLRCKVREDLLIYRKGYEDDGLGDIIKYITSSNKYKPIVSKDIRKFWNSENPMGTIDNLLKNSYIFSKIQELVLEAQHNNEIIKKQIKKIKHEIKHINLKKDNETKIKLNKLSENLKDKLREETVLVKALRDEVNNQMEEMKHSMKDKDKKIDTLWRELKEIKANTKSPLQPFHNKKENPFAINDYKAIGGSYTQRDLKYNSYKANKNPIMHENIHNNSKFDNEFLRKSFGTAPYQYFKDNIHIKAFNSIDKRTLFEDSYPISNPQFRNTLETESSRESINTFRPEMVRSLDNTAEIHYKSSIDNAPVRVERCSYIKEYMLYPN